MELENFYTGLDEISFDIIETHFFFGDSTACCVSGTCDWLK